MKKKYFCFIFLLVTSAASRSQTYPDGVYAGTFEEKSCFSMPRPAVNVIMEITEHKINELPLSQACALLTLKLISQSLLTQNEWDHIARTKILRDTYFLHLIYLREDISDELDQFISSNHLTKREIYMGNTVGPAEFAWSVCSDKAYHAFKTLGITGSDHISSVRRQDCEKLYGTERRRHLLELPRAQQPKE